ATQCQFVRDGARHLGRETESRRHALRPALPGLAPVWAVERRVDLGDVETRGVAREHARAIAEQAALGRAYRPAGAAGAGAVGGHGVSGARDRTWQVPAAPVRLVRRWSREADAAAINAP